MRELRVDPSVAEAAGSVTLVREGRVAVLTMVSPRVLNALTPEMGRHLTALCDEIDADANLGAAVLRGAEGTFCSGADRRAWSPGVDQSRDATYKDNGAIYASFVRFGALTVPTIAAVRGVAVGAGVNMMLAADLRIVSLTARIVAGFLPIGLHPGGGYFTLSGRTAGREATAAMGLFGEEIDGSRAAALGMAWEACPDDVVEARALELATRAAADPDLARVTVGSFRGELGPPEVPWPIAVEFERGSQMWSQRRRTEA